MGDGESFAKRKAGLPPGASFETLRPQQAVAWRNETAARRLADGVKRLVESGRLQSVLEAPGGEAVALPAGFSPAYLGPKDASGTDVSTVIEIADYHSAPARAAKLQTDGLLERSAGQVRYAFVPFYDGNEAYSQLLYRGAYCMRRVGGDAAGEARWRLHERLYAVPPPAVAASAADVAGWKSALLGAAKEAGETDPKSFEECLGSGAAQADADAHWNLARNFAGATEPVVLFNGEQLASGHEEWEFRATAGVGIP